MTLSTRHHTWSTHLTRNQHSADGRFVPSSVKSPRTGTLSKYGTTIQRRELTKRRQLRYQVIVNDKNQMELNLSGMALGSFPSEIVNFSRLEVLSLSHNALTSIPGSIGRLHHLKILYLNHNNLARLPETITNCTNLTEVILTRNKLSALPRYFGNFRSLTVLRLGENKFETIPHDISQLSNLRVLDLHGNRVWYLPFSVHLLHKLKYLNMADNKFEHLPLSICQITSLQFLNLRGNRLVSLAQDFDSLQNLRELNLAFNKIHIIPPAISKLKNLIYLNLAGNKIRLVPDFFKSLNHLTVFHLQFNEVERLPNAFPNMQHLNVADNCLESLAISCMRKLRYLNANNNKLDYLPNGIFCASKLETLKLRGNRIAYIPHDIVSFKKMKVLDLGHNQLTTFPKVIDQMTKLDYFNLRGNAIKYTEDKAGNLWTQRFTVVNDSRSRSSRQNYPTKTSGHQMTSQPYSIPSVSMATGREQYIPEYRKGSNEELDELLQNGFSLRRIHSNYSSVMHLHNNDDLKKDRQSKQGSVGQTVGKTDRRAADFGLLGICNQVEMMLNKDLLQPVLSLQRNLGGKNFMDKKITEVEEGVWKMIDDKMIDEKGDKLSNIVSCKVENFTVTSGGRNFTSSVEPGISIFFPTKAVLDDMEVKLKVMRLEVELLNKLKANSSVLQNIMSTGPIVHLYSEHEVEFKHLVTMTIHPPPSGGKGHLNIVSIRKDNSCMPVSLGYRQKNGSITVNMWTLEGKTAVTTKAKSKYKACRSMELLLSKIHSSSID